MRRRMFAGTVTGVLLLTLSGPTLAQEGEPARGSVKIEDEELGDPDTPNEVKVGCDFRIDFFGFDEQTVPVRLSLQPPSGDEQLAERSAQLEDAQGNDLSGSLDVDLTEELSQVPPADAEDFDHKVRVDVVVKETDGTEVTKSTMLFVDCEAAVLAFRASAEEATSEDEPAAETEPTAEEDATPAPVEVPRPTLVPAGAGGAAPSTSPLVTALAALLLGALLVVPGRRVAAVRRRSQG